MKITLVNNTVAELPLTSGMPNLGRRASMDLEMSSADFEAFRPTLDTLKAKGMITYTIHGQSEQAQRNALVMMQPDVKNLTSGLAASNDSLAALAVQLVALEQAVGDRIAFLEEKLAAADEKIALLEAAKPQLNIFRADVQNVVAQSQSSYAPVNGLELKVPSTGNWVIVGEIALFSPVAPSKGKISLGRFGPGYADVLIKGTERLWVRTHEDTTSVLVTASLDLNAGDTISIYWKAEQGVLRASYRSVTLFRS